MLEYRDIGHEWEFTHDQLQQLKHYENANKFLVTLMHIEGAASKDCGPKLEEELLLPLVELQRRQPRFYSEKVSITN